MSINNEECNCKRVLVMPRVSKPIKSKVFIKLAEPKNFKIEEVRKINIAKNGNFAFDASDGFDAMAEVNVCVDVKNLATLQFNWEGNTSDNTPNYGYYLDDIYEKQIDTYFSNKGQAREGYGDAIFNLTNLDGDWTELYKKVTINDFGLPYSEKKIFVFPQFHFDETATELQIFPKKLYNAFRGCCAMIAIPPIDLRNTTDIRYAFKECYSLVILLLNNWSAGNIDLSDCYNLEYSYLNHLIKYSTGQKMRTLTIPECVNEKWEKYYKYEYYVTLAAEKAITITIK